VYNEKRRNAEAQMEIAKDACEKIKRKRSSLVGAFVSTHGRSIDDVDKSILEAKTALLELTQDLTERSRRWRQIEMLTGVNIVTNPGLLALQKIGTGNNFVMKMLSEFHNVYRYYLFFIFSDIEIPLLSFAKSFRNNPSLCAIFW
jgi:STIM1 Orai1-activating region